LGVTTVLQIHQSPILLLSNDPALEKKTAASASSVSFQALKILCVLTIGTNPLDLHPFAPDDESAGRSTFGVKL
jgi:hypothetical protein